MKQRVKLKLIALLSAALLATAVLSGISVSKAYAAESAGTITCKSAAELGEDYFSAYKVPTSMFTYQANGGGTIANAFDGNWFSYWKSEKDNGAGHINEVTVTFGEAVTIEAIAYASSTERTGYGYPQTLTVYTANGGDLAKYAVCNSTPTNDRVIFEFGEPVTVDKLKFEFTQPNRAHRYDATAKEIVFLQPENESVNNVLKLFTDYTQHTVKEEYKSQLAKYREDVKDLVNYESSLKPLLDRADSVVKGEVIKDGRLEFSTDPNAENVIERRGNLIGYAKDVLKVNAYGYTTNRQVTGLGGTTGSKITVYVDAPNGKDPLPEIVFTQASGYWQNWRSAQSLTRGKNVLTFPQFLVEPNGAAGGPIYIANAYTKEQQSENVKIYIEGAFLMPTFRYGDNEENFKAQLKEYEERRVQNAAEIVDVCEIAGDHFINTTKSSIAYRHYITGSVSPQSNTEKWEKYMTGILAYDGISMNPDDEHFNEKNLYLPVNFRIAHWSGYAAYAVGEHIGLVALGHETLSNFVAPGWGLSHEIGHMLDLGERTRAETTNNMIAVYGDLLMNNSMNTGKAQHIVAPAALYPDETATEYNYFHKNGYSISQWWNLEVAYPGYWGRLDNNYRYYDRNAAFTKAGVTDGEKSGLTMTEKMVYFSSLATGVDLGYYFERYGFAYEATPFKVASASPAYTKLTAQAIADGILSTKQYKYWYFDINQYFHPVDERALYTPSSSTEIRDIWKVGNGYTLVLPQPANADRHLGYEIKEYRDGNWYVIGFTYSESFTDNGVYPDGYVPKYKICAYDRQLNSSAESAEKSFSAFTQTDVCRIENTYYNSLAEAVDAASAGATIYLCADTQESGFTVNKNLFLLPDPSLTGEVVIKRRSTTALITLSGATLAFGGDNAKIVLDGASFTQGSALISVNGGTLNIKNTVLRNNMSTGDGGAVAVTAAGGKLNANGCEFTGNTARNGGAVYSVGTVNFTNCTFAENSASQNGGAVTNLSGGVMAFSGCTVRANKAAKNGGGITVDGKTSFANTDFTGNTAEGSGGALCVAVSTREQARTVTLSGGSVKDNTATYGNIFYLNGGYVYFDGAEGVALSGDIYKNKGEIKLKTAKMNFTDVVFHLPSIGENTNLFTAEGSVKFTDELLSTVRVNLGSASVNEESTQVLVNSAVTEITVTVNGKSTKLKHTTGWKFTLPDTLEGVEIPEGKQLDYWEINGVKYNVGDSVVISEDTQINAVLKDTASTDNPDPDNPSDNPDPDNTDGENKDEGSKTAVIIIAAVAAVIVVAVAVTLTIVIKKRRSADYDDGDDYEDYDDGEYDDYE